jgi:hypothetical protein
MRDSNCWLTDAGRSTLSAKQQNNVKCVKESEIEINRDEIDIEREIERGSLLTSCEYVIHTL